MTTTAKSDTKKKKKSLNCIAIRYEQAADHRMYITTSEYVIDFKNILRGGEAPVVPLNAKAGTSSHFIHNRIPLKIELTQHEL